MNLHSRLIMDNDEKPPIGSKKYNPKLSRTGELNPGAKLKNSEVLCIKQFYCTGLYSRKELADMFGVTLKYIHNLLAGYHWTNVNPDVNDLKGCPRKIGLKKHKIYFTDDKIGGWTVIGLYVGFFKKRIYYLCRCECGTEKLISSTKLNHRKNSRCASCANKTRRLKRSDDGKFIKKS